MKRIDKNPDASVLESLQKFIYTEKQAGIIPKYENFRDKDSLRNSLLRDQGYLCGFCMGRIGTNPLSTKIAHLFPRNPPEQKHKERVERENLDLDYYNMMATCDGGEGLPPRQQHCDTKQGNHILRINPMDQRKNCEEMIKYTSDGQINSDDPEIRHDLQETLNLNEEIVKRNRKMAYETVLRQLSEKFPNKSFTRRQLENEIDRYSQLKNGKYAPYCQYVIYFLQKKLSRI